MTLIGRYNDAKNDLLHAIWDRLSVINGKTFDPKARVVKGDFSTTTEDLLNEILNELNNFSAIPQPTSVVNVAALLAAATGATPKLIICNSDPDYSSDPTLNLWDGANLIVFAGEKRN